MSGLTPLTSSVAIAAGRGCARPLALRGLAFLDLRDGATDGSVFAPRSPRCLGSRLRHRRSPSRLAGGATGPSLCAVSPSSTYGAGLLMGRCSLRALLDVWASPSPSSVAIAAGRGCARPLALRGLAFLDLRGGATDGPVFAPRSPRCLGFAFAIVGRHRGDKGPARPSLCGAIDFLWPTVQARRGLCPLAVKSTLWPDRPGPLGRYPQPSARVRVQAG